MRASVHSNISFAAGLLLVFCVPFSSFGQDIKDDWVVICATCDHPEDPITVDHDDIDIDPDDNDLHIPVEIPIDWYCPDEEGCPPGCVMVTARFFDCKHNLIEEKEQCVPPEEFLDENGDPGLTCESGHLATSGYIRPEFIFDNWCAGIPVSIEITAQGTSGSRDPSGECGTPQPVGDPVCDQEDLEPPRLDCGFKSAHLECAARALRRPEPVFGRVFFWKTERKLYTLTQNSDPQATYGEAVNARFVPHCYLPEPLLGQVVIKHHAISSVVDLYGNRVKANPHYVPHEEGGHQKNPTAGSDGREGEKLATEECVWWDTFDWNAVYDFNFRTYEGSLPYFSVNFHWYYYDEDQCLQEELEVLELPVEPLPCRWEPRDPVEPQARELSNGWAELRLPCCPSCSDGSASCPKGNLSEWFVAWPSIQDRLIRQGHATGWRFGTPPNKKSSTIVRVLESPGPDRLKYEFEDVP